MDFSRLSVVILARNRQVRETLFYALKALETGQVRLCRTAKEAVEEIRIKKPQAVLIGNALSNYTGVRVTRALRGHPDPTVRYVPILMVAPFESRDMVAAGRDAGVNEMATYPVAPATLARRLRVMVEAPRKFVKTETYFGPDRRRHDDPNYTGPERRNRPGAFSQEKINQLLGS